MKRRTKILIAALTNLTFISSAVLAEEGIPVVCEVDKATELFGSTAWKVAADDWYYTYTIFKDRIEAGQGNFIEENDVGCETMIGTINSTDIDVICNGSFDDNSGNNKYSISLKINRRTGEFLFIKKHDREYSILIGETEGYGELVKSKLYPQKRKGFCKKPTGF